MIFSNVVYDGTVLTSLHSSGGIARCDVGSGGRDRTADLGVMNPKSVLVPASYGEKAQ